MKDLTEDIKKSIEKNLPLQVGKVLQERLEQAEKDSLKVEELTTSISQKSIEINQLNTELRKANEQLSAHKLLDDREKEIAKKENEQKVEELKYQLESEKDKTSFAKDVALGLVRNTEYKKTIFDGEHQGWTDAQGQWQNRNVNKTYTEDNKAE